MSFNVIELERKIYQIIIQYVQTIKTVMRVHMSAYDKLDGGNGDGVVVIMKKHFLLM